MAENANNMYESESSARKENESRTLKEIIYDVTEQELSGFRDDTVAADKLKMMAQKQASSLRRRNRLIGAAAVIFVALAGVLFAVGDFFDNVEADKNAREEIVTEDGVVIEDGGWGSSSEDIIETTDWDEVLLIKEDINNLMIPHYVPEGFKFMAMTIEKVDGGNDLCIFKFYNGKRALEIHEYISAEKLGAIRIHGESEIVNSEKGKIFIRTVDNIKKATIQMNDSTIIDILAELNAKEFKMIVNELNY